ncbi:SGNH/GDSL hydrolase family protein [Cohnella yongneupensis]|uniref:SGNH/GDSL hydrolase family protein n=1 Tax=Cohnella yongneupensis TaxID=425006 RepID=A0ABW0R4R8_9BACL
MNITERYVQRFLLEGNELIQFEAFVHSSTNAPVTVTIAFYDAIGGAIKTVTGSTNSEDYGKAEIYVQSPALTRYAEARIEAPGDAYADISIDKVVLTKVNSSAYVAPEIDLDAYGLPLWEGNTVHDEPVMFFAEAGEAPTGKLLHAPNRILSVKSRDLRTLFAEGADYIIDGNKLTLTPNSAIAYTKDADLPDDLFHYYDLTDIRVAVTYTHDGLWEGPEVASKGDRLSRTLAKLRTKQQVRIVAYGDSITRGLNVSSYDRVPPYMPTWVELFADQLSKKHGYDNIAIYNAGLPGATSEWGADEADLYVTPLHPDLVVIAFGMNDFWGVDGVRFKDNIRKIIDKAKAAHDDTEFVLISSMLFDPAYPNDGKLDDYSRNMQDYRSALLSLEGQGIAVHDMTAISEYLYSRKKPKDMLPNPLHPGDYLARWYAQGLVRALE